MKEENELTPIGGEVERQLADVQARSDGIQPEQDEPKKLLTELPDDGVEHIPYNPDIEGFGPDYDTKIQGYRIRIHSTNNLDLKVGLALNPPVRTKSAKHILEANREVFGTVLEATRLEEILQILSEEFPLLYAKITEIITKQYEAIDKRYEAAENFGHHSREYELAILAEGVPPEEIRIKNYYFSKTFDAIATIVSEHELPVDITALPAGDK